MLRLLPVALALALVAAPAPGQEAMTRARREADSPLRMIIEAGKLKEARERARAAAARASLRAAAPAAAASGAAGSGQEPVPAETAAPLASVAEPAAEQVAEPTAAPPTEAPVPAPEPNPVPAAIDTALEPLAQPLRSPPPLRLATMVEPQTPRHLVGRLRGDVEVVVAFTVNADGSVSEPSIRSTTHKEMNPPVLEAVRQWRYEPTGAARAHSVQLVLRDGG